LPSTGRSTYAGADAYRADPRAGDSESLLEWADRCDRFEPKLTFASFVSLRLDSSQSVGETPDGVRLELRVHGSAAGPMITGEFPPLAAHMLVDVEGIGTLNVRAPLVLNDGAVLEIEATVRYDFGKDGYRRALAGNLPDSIVGGGLRFLTGDRRYQWVNRALCLGVGQLLSKETRIDYDLYAISVQPTNAPGAYSDSASSGRANPGSLYQRLGGRDGIGRIVSAFMHGLDTNSQLARQNPRIAVARAGANQVHRKANLTDLLSQLTGGPGTYGGRPLAQVHAPMELSNADWTLGGEEFVRALHMNGVGKADRDELLSMIEALKPDLVRR
jgi:hemoglobin